ncbi:Type IV fimbrial biogenesis protein PilY1 [Bacillus paranthracis]
MPISASSFTFALKTILLSFVSVITGYFAITLPFSNFSSTGLGLEPSACKLFSTYSSPAGISSSTLTSTSFPFSTVFLKLIRYSTSSPNFGFLLFTNFSAFSLPSLYSGVIVTSEVVGSFVSSTTTLLTIPSPTLKSSFTFALKTILLSSLSVISGYLAITFPSFTCSSTGPGLDPSAFTLSFTYSKPFGKLSSILTSASFPFSTVFLKLIRYSTSSPNFGDGLFTTFFASSFPSLCCGVISAVGVSGSFFVSSIIALLTIFPPIFTSSFTFTLKVILLSFVSVISGYFAIILPFSNFSSTESVPAPSAFKLFSTYSKPSGKVSSIFTSASFPFSTVFLKLIRYSTSSPNFGNRLFTTFFASSFPSLCCGIISAFGVSGGCFVSLTIASLTIVSLTLPFTFTLKVILLSFVSVISGYFTITLPFSNFNSTGSGLEPSACKLPFTYSNPFGKSSSIITSASFPCSTVFLKLIRYSTTSSNFGDRLFTTFSASIFPSLY